MKKATTTTTTKTTKKTPTKPTKAAPEAKVAEVAPTMPKPAKAAKGPKAAKPVKAAKTLEVRVYAKGEIYFPKLAVERLGEHKFVAVEVKGKTVTLTPTTDRKAQPVMYCHAAPVLRVGKLLADTGWSKTTQTVAVMPVGSNGMRLELQ